MATEIVISVYSQSLEVVIDSPTHRVPSCDRAPSLTFRTLGIDTLCTDPTCVRIFIDGEEAEAVRTDGPLGEDDGGYGAYGYGYGYGSDGLPGTTHVFSLPEMEYGTHTIRVVVRSTSDLEAEATETIIIDDEGPEITITSPIDDTINPLNECPTLLYTIADLSGISDVNVLIDGEDYGWLPSGTVLDFLKSGLHIVQVSATDHALSGCPEGNSGAVAVSFNLLKPIVIDEIPRMFYVGTDSATLTKSADGIIEEFRILNSAPTDADVAEEFKILREKIRFQLREGEAVISAEEALILQQIGVESTRINLPEESLLLCHYDNNVDSLPGIGDLQNPSSQIIDTLSAGRRVDIVVYYQENTYIDRELIINTIDRIIPAFVEASITFEEVTE